MTPLSLENPSQPPDTAEDSTERARAIAITFRGEEDECGKDHSRKNSFRKTRHRIQSSSHVPAPSLSFSGFRLGSPIKSPSELKAAKNNSGPPQKRHPPDRDAEELRRVSRRTDAVSAQNGRQSSPTETAVEPTDSGTDIGTDHGGKHSNKSPRIPRQSDSGYTRGRSQKHGEDSKRSYEEKTHDEVIVPSKAVRFIIGKQGESIKAITSASGAYVSMDQSFPGPDRKFDIAGLPSQVSYCRERMLRKMEEVRDKCFESRSTTGLQIPRKPPSQLLRSSESIEETYNMWIPQIKIGMLIGTGGATIRSINEKSGAYATVRNERVDGDRKLVLIHGSVPSIEIARDMIVDITEGSSDGPYRQSRADDYPRRDYDLEARPDYLPQTSNHETKAVYIPHIAVRHVIGKSGSKIKQIQAQSGAKVRVSSEEETGDQSERQITITGTPRVIDHAQHLIAKLADSGLALERETTGWDRCIEKVETHPNNESRPGSGLLRRRQVVSEETFSLSAEHIGLLIGKGGVTIKNFQYRSGANIEVTGKNESDRGGDSRMISIIGTRAQVKIAKILIDDRLGLDGEGEVREIMSGDLSHLTTPRKKSDDGKENQTENADVRATTTLPTSATDSSVQSPLDDGIVQRSSENICSSKSQQAPTEQEAIPGNNLNQSQNTRATVAAEQNQLGNMTGIFVEQKTFNDSMDSQPNHKATTACAPNVPDVGGVSCAIMKRHQSEGIPQISANGLNNDPSKAETSSLTNKAPGQCTAVRHPPAQPAPIQQNPYPLYPPHAGHFPSHYPPVPPPMYGAHPMMQYPYYGQAPRDHQPAASVGHPQYPPGMTPPFGQQVPTMRQTDVAQKSIDGKPERRDTNAADGTKPGQSQGAGLPNGGQVPQMAGAAAPYYGYGQPGHPMMYPPPAMYGAYPYGQGNIAGHHAPPQGHYPYPPTHHGQDVSGAPPTATPSTDPIPGHFTSTKGAI